MRDMAEIGERAAGIWPVVAHDVVYEAAGRRLVDGVSLTLRPGPLTCIMGPNGAGKSLLIRLIAGLLRPSAGRITYGVARGARRARIAELLALGQLAALAEQPARVLSGGEQQRLAMVRALAADPALILLDEPAASLDPQATGAVEALVREAAEGGTKAVLVTHDRDQARRLAGEVVFLNRGRVIERAPAAEFFERPQSPEAQAYLAGRLLF